MELESTRIFVKVVQSSSFSKAAKGLKTHVSSVSRAIRRLEKELGIVLFVRTTRMIQLTDAGKKYFEAASNAIQKIEDAKKNLMGKDRIMEGRVRFTAPVDLGEIFITPVIVKMMASFPKLQIDFSYSDEVEDLVEGDFDFALRIGKLNINRMKALKCGEVSMIVVTSPLYLKKCNLTLEEVLKFKTIKELQKFDFLSFSEVMIKGVKIKVLGNRVTSIMDFVKGGGGISILPHFACKKDLKEGNLIQLLPHWSVARFPISLVSPAKDHVPERVKVVQKEILNHLKTL